MVFTCEALGQHRGTLSWPCLNKQTNTPPPQKKMTERKDLILQLYGIVKVNQRGILEACLVEIANDPSYLALVLTQTSFDLCDPEQTQGSGFCY